MSRSVIVTGGASGIGRACAELFAGSGWTVLVLDTAARPSGLPPGIEYESVDVTDEPATAAVVETFLTETGGLHALVNNAAVQFIGATLEAPAEHWHRAMDVNVRAAALLTSLCRESLSASSGSVVNVASVHAVATSPEIGVYAASKGALVALTRALAIELAPDGIRVNSILPGAVDTSMLRAGLARTGEAVDMALASLASRTVAGRVGRPEEIARAIRFLADGDESSYITGAALVVDGGATARLSTE